MPRWYTFAIAICLVLMVAVVANAQGESNECLSPVNFIHHVQASAPELQIVHFVGHKASAIINRYASLHSVNQIDADEMITILVPHMSQARSVFFRDGCAVGTGVIHLDQMRRIMREELGDDV